MERESGKGLASTDPLRLGRGAGGGLEQLMACPGCHESKSAEHWLDVTSDFDPQSPDVVCDECRRDGVPHIPTFALPLQHMKLVDAYFQHMNDPRNAMPAMVKASGLTQKTITEILGGRRAPAVRRVFQLKLEGLGLGPEGVAAVLGECVKAVEHKWNPAEEQFNEFTDFRTRLNTVKYVGKLQELEPPKSSGPTQVNQIVIKTNLGTVGEPREVDSPSRFRVQKPEEIVEIDAS